MTTTLKFRKRGGLCLATGDRLTNEVLVRANEYLSDRQPYAAIKLYTRVLYELCPGHPIAFLNRALAYLATGYPDLAVTDAYRATLIVGELLNNMLTHSKWPELMEYIKATKIAKAPWSVLGEQAVLLPGWRGTERSGSRSTLIGELQYKGTYRLAYALWKCGGGAMSDALSVLEGVSRSAAKEDLAVYKGLSALIFIDIEKIIALENATRETLIKSGKLKQDTAEIERYKMTGIRGLMEKTKATMVKREVYPWNTHEMDLEDNTLESLNARMMDKTTNCYLQVIELKEGMLPKLAVVAEHDIYHGEPIFVEESCLQVVSSSLDSPNARLHCNNCAACLIVPDSVRDEVEETKNLRSWPSEGVSMIETATEPGSDVDDKLRLLSKQTDSVGDKPKDRPVCYQGQKEESTLTPPSYEIAEVPPMPPPHHEPPYQSLPVCQDCHAAVFCSPNCLESAQTNYHGFLCGTGIEDNIRAAIKDHPAIVSENVPGYVHPNAQRLYELLLVRLMALASASNEHPLDLEECKYLDGDFYKPLSRAPEVEVDDQGLPVDFTLFPEDTTNCVPSTKTLPWSFTANVVRPIQALRKMNYPMDQKLERCDGWVINTLLAKIMSSTRLTREARRAIVYGEDGQMRVGLDSIVVCGVQTSAEEVWIGSIHPFMSFLHKAENGTVGNAVIREGEKTICVASGPWSPSLRHTICDDDDDEVTMDVDKDAVKVPRKLGNSKVRPCIKTGEMIRTNVGPGMIPDEKVSAEEDRMQAWIAGVKSGDRNGTAIKQSLYGSFNGEGYSSEIAVGQSFCSGLGLDTDVDME
ncbi:MAG: hypothetical protein M1827_006891 [Pycnora praestabilis]|nr:MAG: hypothetical protein M1827_006891 [Pycnora praestabilis]